MTIILSVAIVLGTVYIYGLGLSFTIGIFDRFPERREFLEETAIFWPVVLPLIGIFYLTRGFWRVVGSKVVWLANNFIIPSIRWSWRLGRGSDDHSMIIPKATALYPREKDKI